MFRMTMKKYHHAVRAFAMTLVKKYSVSSVSKRMDIPRSTLYRWKSKGIGEKKRVYPSFKLAEIKEHLIHIVETFKTVNARIIQAALEDPHKLRVSTKTIYKYLKKLRYSRKRVKTRGESKQSTPERIAEYKQSYIEATTSQKTIVSIDECGFSEMTKSLYGYSKVGQPCIVKNSGSWTNHSLLMAVFSTGRKEYFIFKGSVNKIAFEKFIDYLRLDRKHVIVADNASIHKYLMLRRNRAAIVYTPPYTPEFNPIELCFAEAKREFRDRNVTLKPNVFDLITQSVESTLTESYITRCFRHVFDRYVNAHSNT